MVYRIGTRATVRNTPSNDSLSSLVSVIFIIIVVLQVQNNNVLGLHLFEKQCGKAGYTVPLQPS